jgi:prepilin-type N-terminal cleavage/methylation domain-containing protein
MPMFINEIFFKKRKVPFFRKSFTLIELVVVIAIIAILTGIIAINVSTFLEKAKVAAAGVTQSQMRKAVDTYFADMGFFPPDVNRGWDPGFMQPVPWSPDAPGTGSFAASGAVC